MVLIGPRMRSGDFYNRKKRSKPRAPASMRSPRRAASVSLIKKVLNSQLETKYVAVQKTDVTLTGHINPTTDYKSILPPVSIQTTLASNNVRVGNVIKPTRATVNLNFYFAQINDNRSRTVFVKAYFVTAKSVKALPTAVIPNTIPAGLLEDGANDPVQWVSSFGALQQYYPVCKDNFTVLKTQVIKLVTNGGDPIGSSTPYPDGKSDRKSISYSWTPPTLKYDLDNDTFAGNHAPMMFLVAYSPGFDYDTDASLTGTVKCEYQLSMSFKDA